MKRLETKNLLDLDKTIAKSLFEEYKYPWEVLPNINKFILELIPKLPKDRYIEINKDVWVAKTANVFESAYIIGPTIIGENVEIRHCAFIRGNVIVGDGAVIGNSVELKNSIIFEKAQIPHYNYVGDSVIGYKSHLGAQALTSNVKSDKSLTSIKAFGEIIETKLKKFGAIIGDEVEVGCSSVLNPATVIGRNSNIYPLSSVRGYIPSNSIYKGKDNIVEKK